MSNRLNGIFPNIKPGDVIAFSGNGLDAKIIQWFTGSPYSHTVIVLETERLNQQNRDILIAESTTYTTLRDFQSQQCSRGFQIHWLSHWIDSYRSCGEVWWVPLRQTLSSDRASQMQSWLWQLNNRSVPFAFLKSMQSGLAKNKFFHPEIDLSSSNMAKSLFCSELVVRALQIAGVLDTRLNPAVQTPGDLMSFSCFQQRMSIL